MNEPRPLLSDIDLHAYVDGELSEAEAREVEVRLATDARARVLVASLDAQRAALMSKFALPQDCPTTHLMATRVRAARGDTARWTASRLGLLGVAMVTSVAAGFLARDLMPARGPSAAPIEPAFVRAAIGAHTVFTPEVRHPVEVAATDEKHLVYWLSKRLGSPVRAPKLGDLGWTLVGGRLLADGGWPAAQLMYEDKSGRRVTLFIRTGTGLGDTAFQFHAQAKTSTFYWIDAAVGYALAGAMERAELMELARAVHTALASNGVASPTLPQPSTDGTRR